MSLKGIWQRQTVGARTMLVDGNKILLIRQSLVPGWQFPGGGVDPGENFYDAAKRETYEETGYKITEMRLHALFHNIEATNRDHLAFFIAEKFELDREFKPNREIVEIKWFDVNNLPDNLADSGKRRVGEIFGNKPISKNW